MSNLVVQLVEKSIERLNVNATVVSAWTGNGLTIVFNAADGEVTISGTEWQKALDRLPMAVMSMLRIAEQNAADSPTPNVPVLYPVLSSDVDVSDETVEMLFDVWSFTWERLDGDDTPRTAPQPSEVSVKEERDETGVTGVSVDEATSGDTISEDTIATDSVEGTTGSGATGDEAF